jgi:hypothetical protein
MKCVQRAVFAGVLAAAAAAAAPPSSAQGLGSPGAAGPDRISPVIQGARPGPVKQPRAGTPLVPAAGEALLNNDGSVTLVAPHFGGSGGVLALSAESDLSGVCRHYGYGAAQAAVEGPARGRAARINELGTLAGYDDDPESTLDFVVCGTAKRGFDLLKERVADLRPAPGGGTILEFPFVAGPGGARIAINAGASDFDGACRYFGFARSGGHRSEMTSGPQHSVTAVLCSDGSLCDLAPLGRGSRFLRLASLVCER